VHPTSAQSEGAKACQFWNFVTACKAELDDTAVLTDIFIKLSDDICNAGGIALNTFLQQSAK